MGFLSNIVMAAVKVALTPVAVAVDVVNVPLNGDMSMSATQEMLESTAESLTESVDELSEGRLL